MAHHRTTGSIHARQGFGQAQVEAARTQAAADHQQVQGFAVASGVALLRIRQGGNVGPHRVADHLGSRQFRGRLGEGTENPFRETSQQAVGQARNGILLVDDQGYAQQPGHQAARTGSESPHAQNGGGALAAQNDQGLPAGLQQSKRGQSERHTALAPQTLDAEPVDGNAGCRHQAGFDTIARAHPAQFAPLAAQGLGHGQGGEYMPAGSAGHDQDRAVHARTPCGRRLRRLSGRSSG